MSSHPSLEVVGLVHRYGRREVVHGLDFTLRPGDRVALSGPNGSGKTTIIRCVAGTLIPTAGQIRVSGHAAGSVEARQALGVSFSQERSFYLRLTARENLLFFARVRGLSRRRADARVAGLAEKLELDAFIDKRVDRCSTGMIQQLAFARALIGDPPLLLLDEPTRSLDRDAAARFWAALDQLSATALLIATHNDHDIKHCNHRIDLPVP